MTQRNYGIRALLGLLGIALGVLAFGTGIAQAEKGASWYVVNSIGKEIKVESKGLLPFLQIKEIETGEASLLATVAGVGVKITCKAAEFEFEFARLEEEGKIFPEYIWFSGCSTKLNGSLSKACEPKTGIFNGAIKTNLLKGLLVLHTVKLGEIIDAMALIRVTPSTGTTLATINLGEECSVSEELPITGQFTLKDNAIITRLVDQLVVEGPLSELNALGNPATIDGSAVLSLEEEHKGLKWAGLPA